MVTYEQYQDQRYPHVFVIHDVNVGFMPILEWCFKLKERGQRLDDGWRYDYPRKAIMFEEADIALEFWMRFGGHS
jgi:hypothetical protein